MFRHPTGTAHMPPAAAASAFSRAVPPDPAPSAQADVAAFLHGVGLQALCVAGLAVPERDRAHAVVRAAMAWFVRGAGTDPAAWPERFWAALDRQLGPRAGRAVHDAFPASSAAPVRPFDGMALGHLLAALRALPHWPRQAFLLRVLCDLDLATAARALHLPATALHGALAQAVRSLRAVLDPQAAVDAAHDGGAWLLRCRDLLREATRSPDAGTEARLADAVRAALARPSRGRLRRVAGWAAAATLVCASGWWWLRAGTEPEIRMADTGAPAPVLAPPHTAATPAMVPDKDDTPLTAPDFDLVLDGEDPALLDDPAFYAWLDATGGDAP